MECNIFPRFDKYLAVYVAAKMANWVAPHGDVPPQICILEDALPGTHFWERSPLFFLSLKQNFAPQSTEEGFEGEMREKMQDLEKKVELTF